MRVLIAGLPPEAALFRSMEGMGGWTITDHLLATAVDYLGVVAHNALVGPHVDPKSLRRRKPPEPIQRPSGHRPRKHRRKATSEDLKQLLGGGTVAYRPKEGST